MAQPVAQAAKKAFRTFRELHGVVISAGLMDKTVKVRVGGQKWNAFLKKVRFVHPSHLCPLPASSVQPN
jgi:small subunit ribosomal protein S17